MLVSYRRLAVLAIAIGGLVGVWWITVSFGLQWGLVVLAGLAGMAVLAAAANYLELRRQRFQTDRRDRLATERWQLAQAELRQVRKAGERERKVVAARFDAVSQAQRQVAATAAYNAARQLPRIDSDPLRTRDEEIALLRDHGLFDPTWYQTRVGRTLTDPIAHYVDAGAALGIEPHPLFASARYLERHPDALHQWRTPLAHFAASEQDPVHPTATAIVRYDRHGFPDETDLAWEYLARGLHREPDTFVLYRIIGNDLPPRHRAGQGIENLQFVLDHEPDLPGCEKRWVINRILDPRIEKKLISLLEEHGRSYLHIPFEPAAYRRAGWRFAVLDPPGLTYRKEFALLNRNQQQRVLDHIYHHKNLYVMNNNGARNAALREGRRLAKWVLPFDGNCFLTRPAWDELVATVTAQSHLKYFTVPMARVVDNRELLRPAPIVDPSEEPQILFRRDAAAEFNPDARYGRRPKVELFFRLQVPGPWDDWGRVVWDDPPPPPSPEARQVGQASWVARLFSGQQALEADSNDRQWRRIDAIRECIDTVDQELARRQYDPATLLVRDEAVLERQRVRWEDREAGPQQVVAELTARAERLLAGRTPRGLPAVTESVIVTALAGWFARQDRFLSYAAKALRTGWLSRGARITARGGPSFTLDAAKDLDCLLDAARLLARTDTITTQDSERLRVWCAGYRNWLVESPQGIEARAALDQRGTWYDLQLAALDAYLGDLGGLLSTLRRAHERIGQQFGLGTEPVQLVNLLGWDRLARCAQRVGQDLWSYRAPGGFGLPHAAARMLDPSGAPQPADQLAAFAHLAAPHLPAGSTATDDPAYHDPWRAQQCFEPGCAVMPFWVLGSEVQP